VIDQSIGIDMSGFLSDSRLESLPIQVTVKFSAMSEMEAETYCIPAESIRFDFSLTVGIGEEDGPLVGGVGGTMAGHGTKPLLEMKRLNL